MPRRRNPVPAYRKHRNEARCYAGGRWISLGVYGSEGSRREYERVCAEVRRIAAEKGDDALREMGPRPKRGVSVAGVAAAFMRWAVTYFRDAEGRNTSDLRHYRDAVKWVVKLYGETPAAEFGPLALQAVRQRMVDAGNWCRENINDHVGRIKRVWKWAVSQEMVPASAAHGLASVAGLRKGKTTARETEPVKPVARDVVEATAKVLHRHLRVMVELQLLTGMRPGEVCRMRLDEIDRTGGEELWVYRPGSHKGTWRGRDRVIPLGPKAVKALKEFVAECNVKDDAPLFSPFAARAERFADMRRKRASKVPPSQQSRRVAKPKRLPALAYTTESYAHAIAWAARKAGVEHWSPGQIRHLYATEVREKYGLEAAQVLLGHARADVTQIYAEKNMALGVKVAREIG